MAARSLRVAHGRGLIVSGAISPTERAAWDGLLRDAASSVGAREGVDEARSRSYWNALDPCFDPELAVAFLRVYAPAVRGVDRAKKLSPAALQAAASSSIADGLALGFEWLGWGVYHLADDTGDPSHVEAVCRALEAQIALVAVMNPAVRARLNLRAIVRDTCARVIHTNEFDRPVQAWWRAWRHAVLETLPPR
ncbi:MAG: hypothetical protein U0325_22175 [Polyangiales bacterium]